MSGLYLDQVTPDRGTPGDVVVLRGSGFVQPASSNFVGFNHLEVAANTVDGDGTLIEATIPEGAGPGPVYVRTPNGITNLRNFTAARFATLQLVPAASEISIVGGTTELICIGTYDNGASRDFTRRVQWSSSDPATCSVNAGVVGALREGQSTIIATLGSARATSSVRVEERDLSVLLVLDVSGSMASRPRQNAPTVLDNAKRAAHELLARLNASDRVALVSFSTQTNVLEGHGAAAQAVRNRITQLAPGGSTALYDTIVAGAQLAERERQALPQRAHSILVLSDGVDNASSRRLADAIAEVNRAGVPTYFVYVDGYPVPGGAQGSGAVGDVNNAYDSLAQTVLDVSPEWRNNLVGPFDRFYGHVVAQNDPWFRIGYQIGDVILQWTYSTPLGTTQHRGVLTFARPLGYVTQPGSSPPRTQTNPLDEVARQTGNSFYRTASAAALPSIFNDILHRSRVNALRLQLSPGSLSIGDVGQQAQVQATAEYSGGTTRDVTGSNQTVWATSDSTVLEIVRPGTVRSTGPGGAAVVVFMPNGLSRRLDASVASAPTIYDIVPADPIAGSEILIRGAGFHAVAASNLVELNGTRLAVRGATASLLVVHLLPSSTSGDVTVTVNNRRSPPRALAIGPATPTSDVIRTIAMHESALLFWDHPAGGLGTAAGYLAYRIDPSGDYVRLHAAPITTTVFRDGSLANGVTYRYRLHVVDATGNERRFGDVVTVEPRRVDVTFKLDHLPTFGSTGFASQVPAFAVDAVDAQGQPVTGVRVEIESANGVLRFAPDDPWTDHLGRCAGTFELAPGVVMTQNQFVDVVVFVGEAAEHVHAGTLPPAVRELVIGPEIQVHDFTGATIEFSSRIRAFPGLAHLASKALAFKIPVIDARLQLALEDFFIQIRNDREVVGLANQRLLDFPEGRAHVMSGTRTGSLANFLVPMVPYAVVQALESKPLVVELVIGLIPLGDSLDIATEIARSYITGESPRKSVMVLSGIGLVMDIAELTGVGSPVGIVGNAIVVVARRVVRLVPAPALRMLGGSVESMKNFVRYVGTYVVNPVP
jgi:Mg-chelatase subunit ChlD